MFDKIEGLKDNQLLIKLGGLKELAQLRGYTSCLTSSRHVTPTHVASECTILWIANYETGGRDVCSNDEASANLDNTDPFMHRYLEAIARNRSFVRSVRTFLKINVCCDE